MNYEEMSDFEINKATSIALGIDVSGATEENNAMYGYVTDYCNNWGDAGPIIISAWRELNAPVFDCDDEFVCTEWQARVLSGENKNQLRAAMIVYLEMKDAQK